jgi:hypothetical protein
MRFRHVVILVAGVVLIALLACAGFCWLRKCPPGACSGPAEAESVGRWASEFRREWSAPHERNPLPEAVIAKFDKDVETYQEAITKECPFPSAGSFLNAQEVDAKRLGELAWAYGFQHSVHSERKMIKLLSACIVVPI